MTEFHHPQIKICGLTDPEQAKTCADLGANAIGLVFFAGSPRNVAREQALQIASALPDHVSTAGVFVDLDPEALIRIVDQCGLDIVQLHGNESPEYVARLRTRTGARVIKALFTEKPPPLADAGRYEVDGYLVECGKGVLPGGNAMTWNWAIAEEFGRHYPLVLAGGLRPDNVAQAISASLPDAVDASSGLEKAPGQKDLNKVEQFIDQVRQTMPLYQSRKRVPRSVL